MGTYKTKDEAALAKAARNFIAATKNSVLSIEESTENAKLAKEAALKAASGMIGDQSSEEHIKTAAQALGLEKAVSKALSSKKTTSKDTVGVRHSRSGNWVRRLITLYFLIFLSDNVIFPHCILNVSPHNTGGQS